MMTTLQRTLNDATGAHIVLREGAGDALFVYVYYDDGKECEGHLINATSSASNAAWWFHNGSTYPGPCPCVADNA